MNVEPHADCKGKDSKGRFTKGHKYNRIHTQGIAARTGTKNKPTPYFNGSLMESDLEKLEEMSKSELISLLRKLGGIVNYAIMSDEEKAEAALLKLYAIGMTSDEAHKVIPALDKWFDRTVGKPKQTVDTNVTIGILDILDAMEKQNKPMINVTP